MGTSMSEIVEVLKFYAAFENNRWGQFDDGPPESRVLLDGGDKAKSLLIRLGEGAFVEDQEKASKEFFGALK